MTTSDTTEKAKALTQALGQIEKHYGKGAIMRLGAEEKVDVPVIPTGCLSMDLALGIGGIPRGRVIEIFGPEASGKTTLALHAIAEAQRLGGVAALIDAEHALDVHYARKLGVRREDLLISRPDSGEQAVDIAEVLVRSNAVDMVVLLRDTSQAVRAIAAECGFKSMSHFSSSYRRAYARRPTDERQPQASPPRKKGSAPGKRAASRKHKIR